MKRLLLSGVLLVALFTLSLPGSAMVSAAASSLDNHGVGVTEERYRNLPHRKAAPAPKGPQIAQLQTVPPVPGVTFQIAGQQFVTGADGSAVVMVPAPGSYDLQVITDTYHDPYRRVEFSRWLSETFQPTRQIHLPTSSPTVQVGLDVYMLVGERFVAPDGSPVNPQRITEFAIRSVQGDAFTFHDGQPRWIPASRVTRRRAGGLEPVNLLYTVTSVMVDGSNVVNKAQQQFYAQPNATWTISLLFYAMNVHATDALFGFPLGNAVSLELPNGQVRTFPLDADGSAQLKSLARGDYYFQITGAKGLSTRIPVTVSKDQVINAKVISYLDMGAVLAAGILIAAGLWIYGRFSLRRKVARDDRNRRVRIVQVEHESE